MSGYRYLKGILAPLAYKVDARRRMESANARAASRVRVRLTREEKQQFDIFWKGYSTVSHEFYKAFGLPFDARMVPNDYYDWAEHVLNLRGSAFFLQNKCNLQYFVPADYRPVTILRKINGHFVTNEDEEMSRSEAVEMLRGRETFIAKVARGSGGGRGVQKIVTRETEGNPTFWDDLLKPDDLIFQEVLRQHTQMARFNPDSVNTCRLITLNLNGRCTLQGSVLRMGAVGSHVDNMTSGGGVLIGVSPDGKIHDFGVGKDYSKTAQSPVGVTFSGLCVPEWGRMKEAVLGFHRRMPFVNLIGWDVALNETGHPIIIEINLDSAEIEAVQVFNGPIFGDRLEEVQQYIKDITPRLKRSMIVY